MTTLPQTTPGRTQSAVPMPMSPVSPAGLFTGAHVAPAAGQMTPADVWRVIRSHMLLIIFFAIVGGAGGWGAHYWFLKNLPKYRSEGRLEIQAHISRNPLSSGDIEQNILPNMLLA